MRSKKSIKNLFFAVGGNVINILITFISRTFFIKLLGNEYLGINGLFSNILTLLSLAELGVGASITYCLYKPLANREINKIKSLMNFYKKAYMTIGIIIIALGILIMPFIEYFISEVPSIDNLQFIFLLFVINTASSYLFSYKKAIISADQNNYIVSIYQYTAFLIQNIGQIIILYITRNFILYLIMQILVTVLHNIFISKKADKLYPFLKDKNSEKLDIRTFNLIKKNVSAMIFHKIGSMVVNSTDNILISKLISIKSVGIYSNYSLLINAINGMLVQVFSVLTPSIGHLNSTESNEKIFDTFKNILFVNFWIYSFSSICLANLINPFIEIWIGNSMKLQNEVVLVLIINFYLSGMRRTTLSFRDALGLYWYDRYKPIAECIINLIASIILANKYGIIGIFMGTTISTLATSFWIEPLILYKYGFKKNTDELLEFFKTIFKYTIVLLIVLLINFIICSYIVLYPLIEFIIKLFICIIIPNLIFIILFKNYKEFTWIIEILENNMKIIKKWRSTNEKSNCSPSR